MPVSQSWMTSSGPSRPRRLLPAQRALAEDADQAAQPPDVRRVHLVRHPARLVRADVQVRAGEDRGQPGQDLLHQLEGRGQVRVKPHRAAAVAGQELVLDLVPAGSQVRPQPQQRGGMPGRVDLGNDRDEAVRGVADQVAEVFVTVEGGAGLRAGGRAAQGERPGLVVGQVQVQHVELVELQQVDHPPDLPDREEGAGHVERQAAPGVPRRVQDPRGRHPEVFPARRHQLEQRGQAAGDAGRFRRAQHDPAVLDQQRVAFGGRVAAVRREAGRRGQPARIGRGGQLDRDGRLIRGPVAVDRRQAQARPAGDLGAEPPDERRDRSIGVRDHRARPEGEPRPVPGVEPRRGRYDRVVHRAGLPGGVRLP